LFGEIMRSGERFDLVFIDPWHTYASSQRDLVFGLQLVSGAGIVLVHDCSPPNPTCAEPEFRPGEWCGVTFAAYLDLMLFNSELHYLTVDSDYGCGVISKTRRPAFPLQTKAEGGTRCAVADIGVSAKIFFLS
jgi:hypothetical protein